ncbi:aldehyde-activating protein [Roseibium aquae]|uniref:Aldehyde-activating protein n=1 Tax=Roseibium aquae TaxID=1323746 RepID=A0A916WV69_9HYPH|nr:GFA family protein [Roseibium aquae]GGB32632.1 aldehyde-activating protein [Roseibium aquae]
MQKGGCECGQVRFEVRDVRETVTVCHCSQCRRTSGHLWASTKAPFEKLRFTADTGLSWYASSGFAKRGFCKFCGSSLFYRLNDEEGIAIAAGCLDTPTNLEVSKHIFVKDKADYYDITDGLPQIETY